MLAMQIRRRETQLGNPLKRKKKTNTQTENDQSAEWLKYRISFHFPSYPPDFPKILISKKNHIHNPEKSKFSCKHRQKNRLNTRDGKSLFSA